VVAAEAERPGARADDRLELLGDLGNGALGVPGGDANVAEIGHRERAEDLGFLRRVVGT
jgi:hypothetical protein